MRSNRRLVLSDRIIPFLAAAVGLVALAGAVLVQLNADARTQFVGTQLAELRAAVDQLAQQTAAAATPVDDGTIDAMLALQERMNKLEAAWAERSAVAEVPPAATATGSTGNTFSANAGGAPAAVDPSWPTTDCIPMGTRFMVSTGDEMAICQTPVKVKVVAITGDNVMIDGTGVITETAFKPIIGTNCTLNVFSADEAGFAELRVSCQ